MDWFQTGHRRTFQAAMPTARMLLPLLTNDDWFAAQGNRTTLITQVAARYGLSTDGATARVAAMEQALGPTG